MSGSQGEVEFELVGSKTASSTPSEPSPSKQPADDPMDVLGPADGNGHDQLQEADVRAFDEGNFPLAGPILESSTGRELKGRCSRCETRLRVRVKGPGNVKVRCPICGHTRKIQV